MATPFRWFAPLTLAAGLGLAALAPAPAHAQNDALALTRQIVDIADVVVNGGVPYYRYGHYGPSDRLIVERDYYGRPVYYRMVPPPQRVVVYTVPRPPRIVYRTPPRVVYYAPPRVVYEERHGRHGGWDRRHHDDHDRGHGRGRGHGHDRDD